MMTTRGKVSLRVALRPRPRVERVRPARWWCVSQRIALRTLPGGYTIGMAEPSNLSPQELAARERARQLYQQRAEALRRQATVGGPPPIPSAPSAPPPMPNVNSGAELARRRAAEIAKLRQQVLRGTPMPPPAPRQAPPPP